jgi:Cu(I)/Ag(I) efflux system periplasmic protein CusF
MNKFVKMLSTAFLAAASLTSAATAETLEKVAGQVVKVDAERGKITLKHARIKSINMAAMTMPFKVKDAALINAVKPGDKVLFSVAMVEGELIITQLSAAATSKVRP